jgi:hypothetical protein
VTLIVIVVEPELERLISWLVPEMPWIVTVALELSGVAVTTSEVVLEGTVSVYVIVAGAKPGESVPTETESVARAESFDWVPVPKNDASWEHPHINTNATRHSPMPTNKCRLIVISLVCTYHVHAPLMVRKEIRIMAKTGLTTYLASFMPDIYKFKP